MPSAHRPQRIHSYVSHFHLCLWGVQSPNPGYPVCTSAVQKAHITVTVTVTERSMRANPILQATRSSGFLHVWKPGLQRTCSNTGLHEAMWGWTSSLQSSNLGISTGPLSRCLPLIHWYLDIVVCGHGTFWLVVGPTCGELTTAWSSGGTLLD